MRKIVLAVVLSFAVVGTTVVGLSAAFDLSQTIDARGVMDGEGMQ